MKKLQLIALLLFCWTVTLETWGYLEHQYHTIEKSDLLKNIINIAGGWRNFVKPLFDQIFFKESLSYVLRDENGEIKEMKKIV